MSDRAKQKLRVTERSPGRLHKKKKSRKRSSSSLEDCAIVTTESAQRNSCGKDKRRKSRKKKRHRSSSSDSSCRDSSVSRQKLGTKPGRFLGERSEFWKNTEKCQVNSKNGKSPQRIHQRSGTDSGKHETAHSNSVDLKEHFSMIERQVLNPMADERGRKRLKDPVDGSSLPKKTKKSRKRRKSSSCSSSTSTSSRSSSTSSNSRTSSSSSTSSYERRRRRRKKKKLAKRIKRELKKQKEERRRILKKKMKEKSKEPDKAIKRAVVKPPEDRLLKDINVELADRARAMAPMTKEQWEKKQSVVRRIYDDETGRHRLIKGDGEVLEEIVSRDRHMAINKQATKGDGDYFQSRLSVKK